MVPFGKSMKTGLEKWDEELTKEKDMIRQAWIKAEKDTLTAWLEDIKKMIHFAKITPTYIPTIKTQWVRAVQLKPSTTLGDLGVQQTDPNKPLEPSPARKHTPEKSGAGRSKSASQAVSREEDTHEEQVESSPVGDPCDQPGKSVEDPKGDPKTPKDPPKGPKPRSSTPKGVKPKNTAGTDLKSQDTWYKSGVAYDTKRTGPAAVPPEIC